MNYVVKKKKQHKLHRKFRSQPSKSTLFSCCVCVCPIQRRENYNNRIHLKLVVMQLGFLSALVCCFFFFRNSRQIYYRTMRIKPLFTPHRRVSCTIFYTQRVVYSYCSVQQKKKKTKKYSVPMLKFPAVCLTAVLHIFPFSFL